MANFEPLHEPKTGSIIEQQLHAIPFPIVEPEDGSRERIELHQLLDHRHQRVQHGAEVDRLAMQVLVATPWRQRAGGRHQARTANLCRVPRRLRPVPPGTEAVSAVISNPCWSTDIVNPSPKLNSILKQFPARHPRLA
nr:hypothetical protein [Burkholderia ubonensis]